MSTSDKLRERSKQLHADLVSEGFGLAERISIVMGCLAFEGGMASKSQSTATLFFDSYNPQAAEISVKSMEALAQFNN